MYNLLVTYFYEFRMYESTLFFLEKMFRFLLKCLFSNSFSNMISTEKFCLVLKENKKNLVKKIRGFVDSKFVKTRKFVSTLFRVCMQ